MTTASGFDLDPKDPPFPGVFGFGLTPPEEPGEPPGFRRTLPRSDTVWAWAKEDYATGYTAQAICQSYGLAMSTFRARAKLEGWRRADLRAGDAEELERLPPEPPEAPPTLEMAALAWRWTAEANRHGMVHQARAWMKLHNELRDQARREEERAGHSAWLAERAAAAAAEAEAEAEKMETDDPVLDSLDSETAAPSIHPPIRHPGCTPDSIRAESRDPAPAAAEAWVPDRRAAASGMTGEDADRPLDLGGLSAREVEALHRLAARTEAQVMNTCRRADAETSDPVLDSLDSETCSGWAGGAPPPPL